MTKVQTQLNKYVNRISGRVKSISGQFENAAYQTFATRPINGKSTAVNPWDTVLSNPYEYVGQTAINKFGGNASQFSFNFKKPGI